MINEASVLRLSGFPLLTADLTIPANPCWAFVLTNISFLGVVPFCLDVRFLDVFGIEISAELGVEISAELGGRDFGGIPESILRRNPKDDFPTDIGFSCLVKPTCFIRPQFIRFHSAMF